MNTSSRPNCRSIILPASDAVESIDEKGSFDAEFSLLESTLIELKDEHTTESKNASSSSDVVFEVETGLIGLTESDSIPINLINPIDDRPIHCEISGNSSLESKTFNDYLSCKKSEPASQQCKSINVPVSDILIDPPCNVEVSQVDISTNVPCSSSKVDNSKYSLIRNDGGLLNSKPFHDEHMQSDIIISVCDSSVEEFKINNISSSVSDTYTNIEDIVSDKMDLDSGIKGCDANVVSNISTSIQSEVFEVLNLECSPIHSPGSPQTSGDHETGVKGTSDNHEAGVYDQCIQPENGDPRHNFSPTTSQKLSNSYHSENRSSNIMLPSKSTITDPGESGVESNNLPLQEEKVSQLVSPNNALNESKPGVTSRTSKEIVIVTDSTPEKLRNKPEELCDLENSGCEIDPDIMESKQNSNIYCSTPVVINSCIEDCKQTPKSSTNNFGKMSPLDALSMKNKKNLKRKNLSLQCIEEVDEDASDLGEEKKIKFNEKEDHAITYSKAGNDEDISSSMACFETPAKSVLKKWQTSSFSRSSGASYFIVDECGESDVEEIQRTSQDIGATKKLSHDIGDNANGTASADDFEIACNSLNEELMKGSSNIELLEKYYTQVQIESQIDDEKFDEVLQELTLNYELGDKTSLSVVPMDESVASKADDTTTPVKTIELGESANSEILREEQLKKSSNLEKSNDDGIKVNSSNEVDTLEKGDINTDCIQENNSLKLTVKVKESTVSEKTKPEEAHMPNSSTSKHGPGQSSNAEKNMSILYADGEDMTMDEEDVLLEEDISARKKPYVFFEFVSSDPKENEDNYNPEWQKLGRLTSDEERYKAVRDRWRSLIPPDPNRDLTCRQWREKNHKPPLNLPSRNNNHQMHTDSERNQLCTAVFEMKIKKIVADLDDGRMQVLNKRNVDFEDLAITQDREQSKLAMRGGNVIDLSMLRKQHIEECRQLKAQHDLELEKMTRITEEKIRILKAASEEVMLFQKFYKGFGADDEDEVCLYMTDLQVQELMETEDMLERYTKFYK